ncbi:hypothetical protein SUGI_1178610 [Cryptomeria japonica]|nr:hypothetical protein SUGI_1178610 [Cryptomeria japonica]
MEMGCGLWSFAWLVFMCYIAEAYQNLTVGGAASWSYDDQTNSTAADYNKWAKNQTFSLGDYLIFNTNYNHTVVQTYNASIYDNCDYDNSKNDDTLMHLTVDPSKPNTNVTVSVPLTIAGMNYFFSSAEDGIDCVAGLRFEATVSVGHRFPPNLRYPPPPAKSSGSQTIKAATLFAFGLFLSIAFGFI